MKKIKYAFLALALVVASSACEIAEVNIDPTRVTGVDLNLMLPEAISQAAYNQSANQARVPGIIMQQFKGFDAQQIQYTDYLITEETWNNYWTTGLYSGVLRSCQVIIDKAKGEGNTYYEAIAKIMMAESYGMAALFFGDIPFSEALKGQENLSPAYDSQQQVIAGVLARLDDAIALLGSPKGASPGSADLVYQGNAARWIKTAQGLKARYLIQTVKKDAGNAAKALAAARASYVSLAEQSTFKYESSQIGNNPFAKFGTGRPNTLVIDDRFAKNMTDRSDPRRDFYMENTGTQWSFFNQSNAKLVWAKDNSPVPFVSYVEVKFIEAEALHRTGAPVADVQAALKTAITESMKQIGIAEASYTAYVNAQSDLTGLTGDAVLKRIIEEAYYAYYGYAFQQVWHNYRRTGYPVLTPSPLGKNGLNPGGGVPKRFLYPTNEVQTNFDNLTAARGRQGGGLMDVAVWAFQ